MTALINELAAGPDADHALLVLDDYHLMDSEAVRLLGFLIEHRPAGLHLEAGQPQRPAAGAGPPARPRPVGRAARRGTAVYR